MSTSTSEKALRRRELEASRKLAEAASIDPGAGLPRGEAQAARDRQIAAAQEARTARDQARAELASREAEKQTYFGRMVSSMARDKRRRDGTPTAAEAEQVALIAEIAEAQAERNAAEHERRRKAGLVWEPVGPAGGIEVAAVFSSAGLWDATATEVRDNVHHEPTLHLRDISHLWWCLNAIAAGGGSVTIPAGPGRIPPRWPDYDRVAGDGVIFREDSVVQLERLGYLEIERGPDTLAISYGDRTKALAKSHRETIGRNAA